MGGYIRNGVRDFWARFQLTLYASHAQIIHTTADTQNVMTAIDQLLSLNGWVAALCPTLARPFNTNQASFSELAQSDNLYYIAIVIHSADHFLVDQLAVIVQLSKRLGSQNLFVSMLDFDSTDSTETLTDLCEAVLILLGVPFRIRRVPSMTSDPAASYYPLEEAYTRNLALEPLHELWERRSIRFTRVIWLKGFTCPNDILETIKISQANEAAMVCGMDWAEHNGFFIFSDRWRTRDIEGDQFRQSKSSAKQDAVPPRDKLGSQRYSQHLPFQVFCCEAGTHVVDPAQSYYKGISYRTGTDYHNATLTSEMTPRAPDAPCLDSTQAWFCRDLWLKSASESMAEVDLNNEPSRLGSRRNRRRSEAEEIAGRDIRLDDAIAQRYVEPNPLDMRDNVKVGSGADAQVIDDDAGTDRLAEKDPDANAGSDYDAMTDEEIQDSPFPPTSHEMPKDGEPVGDPNSEWKPKLSIPNNVFQPARILINPRCPTTYAGVSHTQLAMDLFGGPDARVDLDSMGKYVLDDWEGAPESFVCQEQRQTGGRKATKTQRRLGFSIYDELQQQHR
ncbi:glycosyltransferase family 69 protein [Flagelloscypha sp. PMI_526]|nr:glycosyltransferase family 69 protein [Flagelloscypha sp. PMI_526]